MSAATYPGRNHVGAHAGARRGARLFVVLLGMACACCTSPRAAAQVLLVLSDESSGYQNVAEELRSGLKDARDGRLRVDTVAAPRVAAIDVPAFNAYELVVTVGLAAAHAAVEREENQPVAPRILCLLIPRQSFDRLASKAAVSAGHVSALFIDQPLARQFDLLRLALPDKKRVGVILGPSSQALTKELLDTARKHTLDLTAVKIDEPSGLFGALQTVMPASDVLLMLADPVATNADSVYGMLMTAYRAELPVVAFSEGLLNAGALLSVYSTARQQGREGASIAARALSASGPLPSPQYPGLFTVRVNASVARSLGLHLPPAETLTDALSHPEASAPTSGDLPKPGGRP